LGSNGRNPRMTVVRWPQAWWDVIRRIWRATEPLDYDGRFYHLRHVENGSSPQGRDFATKTRISVRSRRRARCRADGQTSGANAISARGGRVDLGSCRLPANHISRGRIFA
jgi:hypothetical protein